MENEELEIIDWEPVKKRLEGVLDWLGRWYLAAVVFAVPLWILTYAYPAPVVRQFLLFVLVGLAVLAWLGRVIWLRGHISWQSSPFNWPSLAVAVAAVASAFLAADPVLSWGGRGSFAESGPLAWLAVMGLGFLIVQEGAGRIIIWRRLLFAYLASSTLLALFVIGWWIFNQELVTPSLGFFSTSALWFSVNALVLSAAVLLYRGRLRTVVLAAFVIHLAALLGYDFDSAWYLLAAGGLFFSVGQLLFEKHLPRVDFKLSFGLVIFSVVLLFVPVRSIVPKLGFDSESIQTISSGVAWPRYYAHVLKSDPLFGIGLGAGDENFWNLAELVDMRQVRQFPRIGNGYLGILWEGGLALLAAVIFLIFCLSASLRRSFAAKDASSALVLALALGFLGFIAVLALVPLDFMILFSFVFFAALVGAAFSGSQSRLEARHGIRSFFLFGTILLLVAFLAAVFFVVYEAGGRLKFSNSIKTDSAGTNIDLNKLDQAVSGHKWVFGYRLARIDFMVQALSEAATASPNFTIEQAATYLASLKNDYSALENAALTPRQYWLLAWDAEQLAAILQNLPAKPDAPDQPAKEWLLRSRAFYEQSLAAFKRNVIIFTDVARFYRQHVNDVLKEGETVDTLYRQAHNFLDRALGIDSSYEQALLERSTLLVAEGKNEEALENIKPLVEQNPAASYNAGHLAFSAKKFEEAVGYFKKAISDNANHLQARYELVQAYLALSDLKSAQEELVALEERAPKDDAATQALLKGLGELLK